MYEQVALVFFDQNDPNDLKAGCMAQLVERRSLIGELSLSCARPAADG